jgi:hypothetical protein
MPIKYMNMLLEKVFEQERLIKWEGSQKKLEISTSLNLVICIATKLCIRASKILTENDAKAKKTQRRGFIMTE